jgi:hypothetical protein
VQEAVLALVLLGHERSLEIPGIFWQSHFPGSLSPLLRAIVEDPQPPFGLHPPSFHGIA